MTFQNPVPLGLFLTPLVPLALYLLTRRRVPVVALATFRFLFASPLQRPRTVHWLEIVLLVLRVLFIGGLLVLLARPTASTPPLVRAAAGREILMLVDCSASMNRTANGTTLFAQAKQTAHALAGQFAPTEQVSLVAVTGRPTPLIRQRTMASAELAAHIDTLTLSPSRANLHAALREFVSGPTVVYFITDNQANSFRELDGRSLLPEGSDFVLLDVGDAVGANVAVQGDLPPTRAVVGLPLDFTANVVNHSTTPADVGLAFTINDKEVERHTLHLGPHERRTQAFAPFLPPKAGLLHGAFTVTNSTDAFAADNRFAFALAVEPQVPVLLVNGHPSDDPYENETLYLRTALRTDRSTTEARRGPTLDVTEEPESAWHGLDESQLQAKLARYAVVVLANCGSLQQANPNAYAALRQYVQEGGGLLLAPGDRVQAFAYNTAFFPMPLPSKDQLTPVRLGVQPSGNVDDATTFRAFGTRATTHPLFALFQRGGNTKYFDGVRIKKHWPLQLPPTHRANILAEYTDRTPAIIENRFGDGRVLLLSFPLNGRWSNFPLHGAEFVPFVLQAITHLQRRSDVEGPSVVAADAPAMFAVAPTWTPLQGRVVAPSGRATVLNFEHFAGRQQAAFTETQQAGFYTAFLMTVGGAHQATRAFAVNTDADESDPTRISEEQVQGFFPTATLVTDAHTPRQQREHWRYVVSFLLVLVVIELLLATRR